MRILNVALGLLFLVGLIGPLAISGGAEAQTTPRMVGYVSWSDFEFTWLDGSTLDTDPSIDLYTHVVGAQIEIVSTANVTVVPSYSINATYVQVFSDAIHAHPGDIKALTFIYGSTDDLAVVVSNNLTDDLAANIVQFLQDYDLDGVVIDYEAPMDADPDSVDALIDALYPLTSASGYLLASCGSAGKYYPDMSPDRESKLDWIDVMTYDMDSWAGADGYKHALYANTVEAMNKWLGNTSNPNFGFSADKLNLGIPFYGRDETHTTVDYADIVAALSPLDSQDEGSISGNATWWNGRDTVEAKVQWAVSQDLGGIFSYSIGIDDLNTSYSLSQVMYDTLFPSGPPPTLSSIAISPTSLSVSAGGTQQFSAIGTYSDNSVATLTSSVTWNSSNPVAATIAAGGLLTGLAAGGSTTITASLSGVTSNSATVTVVATGGTPTIPQPTYTTDQIVSISAFENLAETGDVAIVFRWDLSSYSTNGTYPDTPASLSIIFQLYDTDGVTLLSTASPYVYAPFGTNGYGQGVSSFYFSAADNLTTNQPYLVRIQQSALYFTSPTSANYTMVVETDWDETTQDDMYDWFIQTCDFLLVEYPTVNLKASTDIGLVLSTYGEAYFRAAVPGIQTLCPQLFYVQDYLPVEMTVTPYNTDLQDQYSARMQASEIKRGADRLMAHFGLEGYFGLGFLVLAACIASGIYTSKKGWGLEPGLIGASIISVGGALLMGNAVFTIVMIGSLVAVMALMFTFVGRRA